MGDNYSINFYPHAEKEFIESVIWYETLIIDLGSDFFRGNTKNYESN